MRCLSCDKVLSDYESTRRSANTEEYVDLCNRCFYYVKDDLNTIDRADLVSDDCLDYEALEESGLDIDIDEDQ
jgi:hypothetical protein